MEVDEVDIHTEEKSNGNVEKPISNGNLLLNALKKPESPIIDDTETPSPNIDYSRVATIKLVEASSSEAEQTETDTDFTPIDERSDPHFQNHSESDVAMDYSEAEPVVSQNDYAALAVDYFCERNVVELARCSWRGSSKRQRYLRGCVWSPDGLCV